MTKTDLAWLAGYLEGEGSFMAWRARARPTSVGLRISASSVDMAPLLRCQRIAGGTIAENLKNGPGEISVWTLAARREVVVLATSLRPSMSPRRREQIDRLLAVDREFPPRPRLIQLRFRRSPWKLLVTCQLLNRTSGKAQVLPMLDELFRRWPTAEAMSVAGPALEDVLRPLGLWRNRAATLRAFSREWMGVRARRPSRERLLTMPGIGEYAADAYDILVRRDLSVRPKDKELRRYLEEVNRRRVYSGGGTR